jgi:UDP:flavonoid glycosyltransferase YjiC (YdhE family)
LATVVFFPEGAFGPTNNCVGIGDVLRSRGHRVVFIVEESFAGTLEARGFEERLMRLGPAPEVEEAPGQFWKDFVRETAPEFRKPTIDQLETFILPVWEELVDGARYVDDRLREIFGELEPDVIVQDNVVGFPSVPASGLPWVRIVSLPRAARAAAARVLGLLRGARRAAAARARVHPRVAVPEPVPLPGRGRLPALPFTRRALAAARLVRALGRRAVGADGR